MRTRSLWLTGRLALTVLATSAASVAVAAQDPVAPRGMPRDSLEARVRVRMAQVVRQQLALTDDQARRLAATNQRLDGRRRALMNQEREARASLRVQLDRGDSASAPQVAALLDRLMQLQRSRLELMEEEQRELATYLTPVQRARFLGLQEQVRQRVEGMPLRPGGPSGGAGPGGMRGRAPGPPRTPRPPQDDWSRERP